MDRHGDLGRFLKAIHKSNRIKRSCRRRAFTLVEVILVVAIIMIASSMAVPAFFRSFQAANIRTGARMVVTAGKYARNMAVLQQRQVSIFFDTETGEIRIVASERAGGPNLDAFLDATQGRGHPDGRFTTEVLRTQSLPEHVRITQFNAPSRFQEVDGVYWVNYFPSGVSDSYSLRISDEQRNRSVVIEVDHLSGATAMHYD